MPYKSESQHDARLADVGSLSDRVLDALADAVPAIIMACKGQTTREDRLLYYWAASHFFAGSGTIVDGGALVGSTTIAFAEGLRANPRIRDAEARIHVYDLFVDAPDGYTANLLRSWFNEESTDNALAYDFQPHFRRETQAYEHMMFVHKGDMMISGYSDPRPIEILSIDVAKTPGLMRELALGFFPYLAERSLILHQDFIFSYQPWLIIAMERLSDIIERVYDVPTQCTSAFMPLRSISRADIEMRMPANYYSLSSVACLYDAIERARTPTARLYTTAALAYFYHEMEQPAAARTVGLRLLERFRLAPEFIDSTELRHLFHDLLKIDYKAGRVLW